MSPTQTKSKSVVKRGPEGFINVSLSMVHMRALNL